MVTTSIEYDIKLTHEKTQLLVDLEGEICEEKYTTVSQVFGAISNRIDDLIKKSKRLSDERQNNV